MFPERPENNKNNDELLDDLRQKLSNSSSVEYEEKRNDLSVSKNVFIGAVSGVALAAVVGWFVLSPRYAANNPEEIPVVRRPQTAVKVAPAEPGGMEILNQDKTVYDIIDKKGVDTAAGVENILPPPEEPKLPVIHAPDPSTTTAVADSVDGLLDANPATPDLSASDPAKTIAQAQQIIKTESTPTTVPTLEPAKEVKTAPVTAPAPEAVKIPAKEAVQTPSKATSGSWQVQLMASSNKNAVTGSWSGLTKKYPLLKNYSYEIETADLGAKGIFYRLQAGAFGTRSEADSLCNDLKALGGSCIVKKK